MSKLEDELGQIMAEHNEEAPTAADLLAALPDARRRGRSSWYVVAAAALLVVAVFAGVWAARGPAHNPPVSNQSLPARTLSCPSTYGGQPPWVPAKATGVDAGSRLIPTHPPASALICAYQGLNGAQKKSGWALSGQQRMAGGLGRLAAELSWQPHRAPNERYACTLVAGTQVNYLIGLTYSNRGTIWVSVTDEPNHCVQGSNGEFTTNAAAGSHATKAFSTGTWPARQPASCQLPGGGRFGQDTTMVPAGATSLTICTNAGHVIRSGYRSLISALNKLATHTSSGTCTAHGHGVRYQLLFSYPNGPPAVINVDSVCRPPVGNPSLQADSTGSVLPIIKRLLNEH